MKKILYLFIYSLFFCTLSVVAQKPVQSVTLSKQESGNKNYVARDFITLKPGFEFKADNSSSFSASIDECLLFPPTSNTYATPNGSITTNSSLGGVVGSIPGHFDVSPSGAATYTIPIEVAPGVNGMQPNLSLVYNSQAGNGIAGWGWNIGSISKISRVPKSLYYDNEVGDIDWTKDSPLALDGQRLIKISDTEYRTENESFSKITVESMQSWGPEVIKVQTKDGIIMEYGRIGDITAYSPISSDKRMGWMLSKVTDPNGNYTKYRYGYAGGIPHKDYVLLEVSYGNTVNEQEKEVGRIGFNYTTRNDVIEGYIDGTKQSNNRLLKSIVVYSNNTLYRRYVLEYSIFSNGKNKLNQIQLNNNNGESLNPITIYWKDIKKNITTENIDFSLANTSYGKAVDKSWSVIDIDGDGVSELVSTSLYQDYSGKFNTVYEVFEKKQNSNSIKKLNTYISSNIKYNMDHIYMDISDIASIKHTDINDPWLIQLCLNRTKLWCFLEIRNKKADNFGYFSLKSNTKEMPAYSYGDLNNDGYDDIIIIENKEYNGKYPIHVIYGNPDKKFVKQEFTSIEFNGIPKEIFVLDHNNNGLKDLLVVTDKGYDLIENKGGKSFNNSVLQLSFQHKSSNTTLFYKKNKYCVIKPGDFNGDGLIDFIVNEPNSTIWYFAINDGNGGFIKKSLPAITAIEEPFTKKNDNKDQCIVFDFDNDGKDDIIIVETDYKKKTDLFSSPWGEFRSSYVAWYKSDGSSVQEIRRLTTNQEDYSFNHLTVLGDFDGNGQLDLLNIGSNLYNNQKNNNTAYINTVGNSTYSGVVSSVIDSYQNKININYDWLHKKNIYTYTQNTNHIKGGLLVANEIDLFSNNNAIVDSENYLYKNGVVVNGKGFLGFKEVTINNTTANSSVKVVSDFISNANILVPSLKEVKQNGVLVSKTETDATLVPLGSKRFLSKLNSVKNEDVLNGTVATTSYSNYDSYGNPKTISTNWGGGISETQSLVYTKAGSWCDNKIKTITTTKKNNDKSESYKKSFEYFSNGNLKEEILNPKHSKFEIKTSYQYDAFGNPTNITISNQGKSRSTQMTYTPSGRFLATEKDNQLNETTTYSWDESKAQLKSKTTSTGTTIYEYDGFGRLVRTKYPDKVESVRAYQWAGSGGPAKAKYYIYDETSGQGSTTTWYDALGRELRTDFYGFDNKQKSISTEYNSKGQLYRVSEPYFTNSGVQKWAETYNYDNYGRVTNITTPQGATTYTHGKLTKTVKTPMSETTTKYNAVGQVTENIVNGKSVKFEYYPSGAKKNATPDGQSSLKVSYEYDILGNLTETIDPNSGTITAKYNGFGDILESKRKIHDDSDIITTYSYLPSGFLDAINLNGEITKHTYDNKNRLESVAINGVHTQTFEYDRYNRPILLTEVVDGETFKFQTEYDGFGRVKKEIYPTGYYTTNEYDANGFLKSISTQRGQKIYEVVAENVKGQITAYKHGGDNVSISFDDKWNLPNTIISNHLDLEYEYNDKGFIASKRDYFTDYTESFLYDNLLRLDSYEVLKGNSSVQKNSMQYDATTGSIKTKGFVGDAMSYQGQGKPPHAVSSIPKVPTLMDETPQYITYTDFSKVKQISQGNQTHTLTYGVDRERIKSVSKTANTTTKTKYYLGNYEEEHLANGKIRKLHYIYTSSATAGVSGSDLKAVYVENNGKDTLYYTHTDYQGNLIKVTDDKGKVMEQYAYDPWGLRRNPTKWHEPDTRKSFLLDRGYTLHEHLDDFGGAGGGLINMNGRVYDPLLAQFLSPDPYIQAPDNWLNYNRYAYGFNNPLMFTDPDGEWILVDDLIAAGIGGLVNLGVNIFNGNLKGMGVWETIGKGAAAFGAGAASGTLALYGPAGWAAGGAITGGTNAWLGGATTFKDITQGVVVGTFSGVVGGAVGQYAANGLGGVVVNGLNVTSPVAKGIVGGTIGGAAGGYVGGFTGGYMMTNDLATAHQAGMNGMISGASIGGVAGGIGGYAAAKKADINPWTGKPNKSTIIGGPQSRVNDYGNLLGSETIDNNRIQNWPDDMPAYIGKDIVNPKALEFNQVWMDKTIKAEYYIYDIGRQGYSPFYNGVELPTIQNYNYGRVYKATYIKSINTFIIYK